MVVDAERTTIGSREGAGTGLAAHLPFLEPLLVAPDEGLFLFSPTFTYLYANDAGAAMTGDSPADLVGVSFPDRFPVAVEAGIVRSMQRAIATGEAQHVGPFHYDDGRVAGDFEHIQVAVPDGVLVFVRRTAASSAPQNLRLRD